MQFIRPMSVLRKNTQAAAVPLLDGTLMRGPKQRRKMSKHAVTLSSIARLLTNTLQVISLKQATSVDCAGVVLKNIFDTDASSAAVWI